MKETIIPPCFGLYLFGTAWLALAFGSPAQPIGTEERAELLRKMDQRASHFGDLSRQIWEFAEVGYKEARSSELLTMRAIPTCARSTNSGRASSSARKQEPSPPRREWRWK
jgi:hypothetical protein